MKLALNRDDWQDRYKQIAYQRTRYEHFNRAAQRAIRAVGIATFYNWNRTQRHPIFPSNQSDDWRS